MCFRVSLEPAHWQGVIIPPERISSCPPVPRNRSDAAYFAPLRSLHLHPETELYLGLVHITGGVEGTLERIKAAQQFVSDFGVATECGFGRRPPDTIPELLRIHSQVAAPVAG